MNHLRDAFISLWSRARSIRHSSKWCNTRVRSIVVRVSLASTGFFPLLLFVKTSGWLPKAVYAREFVIPVHQSAESFARFAESRLVATSRETSTKLTNGIQFITVYSYIRAITRRTLLEISILFQTYGRRKPSMGLPLSFFLFVFFVKPSNVTSSLARSLLRRDSKARVIDDTNNRISSLGSLAR